MKRRSGVLMHISSLSSPYGIGTLGKTAYEFVDFLKDAGQTYWQMLPIFPTSFGDSPYASFSAYAGNPYFIDFDLLTEKGYLTESDYKNISWCDSPIAVDYGLLYEKRFGVLRKAVDRFLKDHQDRNYEKFIEDNQAWLDDYGLYMALKYKYDGAPWSDWEDPDRLRKPERMDSRKAELSDNIRFWKTIQYFFYCQWNSLREYAHKQGIQIIGDIPIYVALDSADTWAHPEQFQLDENLTPKLVSGCPPDGFSEDGQLWGNPLYDWEYMETTGYKWWVDRIDYLCHVYDILRIDHFRGFDSYYAIPYGAKDAKVGAWKLGPGMKLFNAINKAIGKKQIIAEDLGFLTDSVRKLLKDSTYPGMKVLEFAFDTRDASSNDYLPHNYPRNCVAYTGTHDNDTMVGWFSSAEKKDVKHAREYLRLVRKKNYHWEAMQALWMSVADTTIVQAQDLLGLGSEARMNVPSTTGGNWTWRAEEGAFDHKLALKVRRYMKLYGRFPS